MNYYIIEPDLNDYYAVGPKNEATLFMVLDHVDHQTKFTSWHPLEIGFLRKTKAEKEDEKALNPGKTRILADLMDFNATFVNVLSERAKQVMSAFLDESTELLPVSIQTKPYYILHVTKVIDAVDLEKSEVEKFSSGKIMRIKQYVLKRSAVDGNDIFRVDGARRRIFASERVVQAVTEAGLTGYKFIPVGVSDA